MEALSESVLVFGRASLGACIGLAIGWPTQKERHSRYVAAWMLAGFLTGVATMWPNWGHMIAAVLILPLTVIGLLVGWGIGVAHLGGREDWWLRMWGVIGLVVSYQLFALLLAAPIAMSD